MEDPALSRNFVDGAAIRRYNFFKYAVLALLLALLIALLSRCGEYNRIGDPTISGPTAALTAGAGAFALSGTGTPGSDIDIQQNGVSIGTATVDGDGNWSLANVNLDDAGSYNFQAFALDPDGGIRGESADLTLEVFDTVVEVEEDDEGMTEEEEEMEEEMVYAIPTLSGPSGDITGRSVDLSGTGTPGSTIEIFANGLSKGTVDVDADGNWSFTADAPALQTEFIATAYDPDGGEIGSSNALGLVIPGAAAALALTAPSFGDLTATDGSINGPLSLSGTGEPGSIVTLSMVDADGNIFELGMADVDADGNWSFDSDVSLPAGTYDLKADMSWPDGLALGTSELSAINFSLAPMVPEFGSIIANGTGRTLNGKGTPNSLVDVWVNGVLLGAAETDGNGEFSFDLGDLSGDFELELRVTDNPELTTSPFVVFNRQAIDVGTLTATDQGDGNFAIDLGGVAEPGSQVGIYVDGELVDIVVADDDGNWIYNFSWPEGSYDLQVAYGDISFEDSAPWTFSQGLVVGEPTGTIQLFYGGEGEDEAGVGAAPPGSPAVHIILDASWSMTQPLGEFTRYEVARDAVAGIVNGSLPAGTQAALRIFGNLEGNLACQSDLMIPYGILDRELYNDVITTAEPQFDANTAIGASLAAVTDDLAGIGEEEVIIVLLTDGEETCGGDPAAEIEALNAAGFNVVVNIVGLSIDDATLQAQFQDWAALGNGTYFAANDAESLASALTEAMQVGYVVRDDTGSIVGVGRVGGAPVEVAPGTYEVQVLTSPRIIFEEVTIVVDEATEITLSE